MQALREAYKLQGSLLLRNCAVAGLDAAHPLKSSMRRLFLFEVEQVRPRSLPAPGVVARQWGIPGPKCG